MENMFFASSLMWILGNKKSIETKQDWLVVSTPLKNMLVKLGIFPKVRDENKKHMSCHHPTGDLSMIFSRKKKTEIFQPFSESWRVSDCKSSSWHRKPTAVAWIFFFYTSGWGIPAIVMKWCNTVANVLDGLKGNSNPKWGLRCYIGLITSSLTAGCRVALSKTTTGLVQAAFHLQLFA